MTPAKITPFFLQWWTDHASGSQASIMWESWQAPHRQHLLLALQCLSPLASLYELGCGAGPNLRLIHSVAPHLLLRGLEPAEGLAIFASEQLGISVDRLVLPTLPDQLEEIVLSCYTLAYLDPEDVRETLEGLRKCSHVRALILMEPMGQGVLLSHGEGSLPAWHHDYQALCSAAGWQMTWRWPIVPSVDGLNAVMIVE